MTDGRKLSVNHSCRILLTQHQSDSEQIFILLKVLLLTAVLKHFNAYANGYVAGSSKS